MCFQSGGLFSYPFYVWLVLKNKVGGIMVKKYIELDSAILAIETKMQEYINKSFQPLGFGKYREDSLFTDAALGCRASLESIKVLPVVTFSETTKGKWMYNENDYIPYCSECMMPQDSECNYCPNCGADMRSEENNV